ncbi:MAG: hypothetical protein U0270_00910 [Labilithrix sp.]
MNPRFRYRLMAGAAVLAALAACVVDPLNPQPLPPGPDDNKDTAFGEDAGAFTPRSDGGVQGSSDAAVTSPNDSSPPTNDSDAGPEDGGADAADAGDADADAGPS